MDRADKCQFKVFFRRHMQVILRHLNDYVITNHCREAKNNLKTKYFN
jgi:uncharacterized protein YdiU (UPF0061 family)